MYATSSLRRFSFYRDIAVTRRCLSPVRLAFCPLIYSCFCGSWHPSLPAHRSFLCTARLCNLLFLILSLYCCSVPDPPPSPFLLRNSWQTPTTPLNGAAASRHHVSNAAIVPWSTMHLPARRAYAQREAAEHIEAAGLGAGAGYEGRGSVRR